MSFHFLDASKSIPNFFKRHENHFIELMEKLYPLAHEKDHKMNKNSITSEMFLFLCFMMLFCDG